MTNRDLRSDHGTGRAIEPEELVQRFQSGDDQTKAEILRRPDCPSVILNRAPKLGSVELNRIAAAHSGTCVDSMTACTQTGQHWSVRHAVLARPDLSERIATLVASTWRNGLPRNRVATDRVWSDHLTYPPSDLACLAANPAAPPGVLETLAGCLLPVVQVEVARNPSAAPECIARLLRSDDAFVAAAAASNPSISGEVLREWLGSGRRAPWVRNRIALNPACPPDLVEELREWIALGEFPGNPDFDPDREVGTPFTTETDLLWNASVADARGLWAYSALPRIRARRWSFEDPLTVSPQTAEWLAEDRDPTVRASVLELKALSRTVARILKDDPDPAISQAAVRFATTPGNLVSRREDLASGLRKQRQGVISDEDLALLQKFRRRWIIGVLGCSAAIFVGRAVVGSFSTSSASDRYSDLSLDRFMTTLPEKGRSATTSDRIHLRDTTTTGGEPSTSDLYRRGKTARAAVGSGLSPTVLWLRDKESLQLMFSVSSISDSAAKPTSSTSVSVESSQPAANAKVPTRTIETTWTQSGFPAQTKVLRLPEGRSVTLDVLIETDVAGTFTVRSTDDLAPISITCDLTGGCVAD